MAATAQSATATQSLSTFLHVSSVAVFLVAAAATLYFVRSMSDSMPMPGGWNMSMTWTPMGSWFSAAAMFCLMWVAMMVFMMLPSSWPVLMLVRRVQHFHGARHPEMLVWTAAFGYFSVWTGFGVIALGVGAA